MAVMAPFTRDEIVESFLAIIRYGLKYFNIQKIDVLEFWCLMISLQDEHPQWKPALLIIELCLCAPFANAALERLFSQMNLIKTNVRNRLKNNALNVLLRIRISGLSMDISHKEYVHRCVNWWYQRKDRRVNQCKRKSYEKRKTTTSKRPHFVSSIYLKTIVYPNTIVQCGEFEAKC